MRFTLLRVQNFRNYPLLEIRPSPGTTVLYGANGAGKTNVLEAMHLLSLGRSHRTAADREMIAQGEEVALVRGEALRRDGKHEVEVRLYPFDKPQKRVLLYDKPAERIADMMGHITCVMFSPEDIRLIRDGPAARRRFMDMQISQIRPSYLRALRTYLTALESRNALLKAHRISPMTDFETQLDTWDEQLIRAALPVAENRRWFLLELAVNAADQYASISEAPGEVFTLRYQGALANCESPRRAMEEGLKRTRGEDVQRLFTSFGPHRDDIQMLLGGKDLKSFGSQGQIRTAVLSMKLGEIALIEHEMEERPALLLDDVFSELDVRRRNALIKATRSVQTFLTCTDRQDAAGAHADIFLHVSQDGDGCANVRKE
ncbi:MAG: DNA replication/repair protein RecF [Clostridia bacterium]|nr:DNA replication/repair protein RecF [Clostridia bacterium]